MYNIIQLRVIYSAAYVTLLIYMKKLKASVEELNALLKEGKVLEAFESYYDKNVTIHVDGNSPITGKEQKREMIFLQEIGKLIDAKINLVAFGGVENDVSITEWAIDIENKEGVQKTIYRVNIQHWKDDKVINEKIYFCGDQKFKVEAAEEFLITIG
jgi:hypothetical protein